MALNDFDAISNIPPYLLNILSRPGSGRTIKPVNDGDSTKRGKTRKKKNSPYLFGDKVQLISRITTEKKVQRQSEIYSSFPLANNLYRASSDEFKALKKIRRKARKSVLTLPNVPAPMPNACTVSDMNDSDYYKNEKKIKSTKRYSKPRTRGIEFFDRDAHRFESSSHNMLLKNGDGKAPFSQAKGKYHEDMQDVWSVLRNINKFQFRSKHLVSDEDSLISARNKKNTRKFRTRKGRRLIGTCRTEEVAYVADFEIQSKSASRSSSFDRITVIDKIDLQNETNLKNNVVKVQSPRRIPYKPKKMIPLNENNKKVPNAKVSQVKDNRFLANTKKQNDQMNKVVNKTAANVNLKQPESESVCTFEKSIDSSNCLRMFNNEPSDCSFIFNDKEDTLRNIINNQAFSNNKNSNGLIKTAFNNSNTKINHQINKGPLKPRLVTTMPSAATMPKPAAADIKRKLTQLKFPIVVLDKDEISSTVEVFDYEPPQFSGLNNHIWPFMLGWKNKQTSKKGSSQRFPESITGHERKAYNEVALARSKDRKTPNLNLVSKKDMDSKRGIQIQQELSISPDGLKKIKPMRQFKDKMLKLLYKNSYPSNIKLCQNAEPVKVTSDLKVKVDAGTEMTVERKYIHEKPKNIVRGNTHIATIATATLPRSTLTAPTVGRVGNEEQNIIPKKHDGITDDAGKSCNSLQAQNRRIPGTRPPWAKAKWASDFIENVIRKIKNGSYYGTEEKRPPVDKTVNLTNKTVQIQEDRKCDGSEEIPIHTCNQLSIEKIDFEQNFSYKDMDTYDPFMKIPGFDDSLQNLEIQSLNANEIQVKNCITNVVVHFDVSVPNRNSSNAINRKSSSLPAFTRLCVSESNTRIYKCSTSILNAILPAELCTVVPKLMRNIFDSDTTLVSSSTLSTFTLSEINCGSQIKAPLHEPTSHMSNPWCNQNFLPCNTYPHLQNSSGQYAQNNQLMTPQMPCNPTQNQWLGMHTPWNYYQNPRAGLQNEQSPSNSQWNPPYAYGWPIYLPIYISPRLISILQGKFGYSPRKQSELSGNNMIPVIKLQYYKDMIIPKRFTKAIMAIVNPIKSLRYNEIKPEDFVIDNTSKVNKTVTCTAIQIYKPDTKWTPSLNVFRSLVQKMWNYCKIHCALPELILNSNTNIITTFGRDSITVDLVVSDAQRVKSKMSVTFTRVNNCLADSNNSLNVANIFEVVDLPKKTADYSKVVSVKRDVQLAIRVKDRFIKKKSYMNLYKKCKSSNDGDGCYMRLSNISNIEGFATALGAAKTFCGVFDENASQKILSCVEEMKQWINYISPSQALLVLLLANKKETPNLLRFRPVLLQGIAVNRITRVTELDMEIEVIERENMQLSEREGITYIPASVANQDSLLDELLWIAKTTASDYQKPFDETSERLLRALLGKRKKLNASYLRVMARYVGLGLLKKPSKFD